MSTANTEITHRLTVQDVQTGPSEETLCFRATVCLDGKPKAIVSNAGRGGSCKWEPTIWEAGAMRETRDLAEQIRTSVASQVGWDGRLSASEAHDYFVTYMAEGLTPDAALAELRTW